MREKIYLLILVACLINLVGIKGVGAEEHENCTAVVTTEFQGKVCLSEEELAPTQTPNSNPRNSRKVERREGKWVNSDGSVFKGLARVVFDDQGQIYSLSKRGSLISPTFQGGYFYVESPLSYSGKIMSRERMDGKWRIRPELKLKGYIEVINPFIGGVLVIDKRVPYEKE